MPNCPFKFQLRVIYKDNFGFHPKLSITGDFNGDNQLDLAFFDQQICYIVVRLGNGDGSFATELISSSGTSARYGLIAIGDFNNDNQLDLAFADEFGYDVGILLGNGNGTFEASTMITIGNAYRREGIIVDDFNRDSYLDLAVLNTYDNNVDVLLGNGDGTLSAYATLYTGRNSQPKSIAAADFNNDHYVDIAVVNYASRNIGVFLGYGNGTFQAQKTFFTGGGLYPIEIAIEDINNDSRPDVIFSYDMRNMVGVLFGHGNGTLGALTKVRTGNVTPKPRIAVSDFNGDGHVDIAVGHDVFYGIDMLLGHGNGNFTVQDIFSIKMDGLFTDVVTGDFNGDGYQDIITTKVQRGIAHILLNTCESCTTENFDTSSPIY